jgi:hypothetical protein
VASLDVPVDSIEREELIGDGLELIASGKRGKALRNALIDRYRSRHPGSRSANPPVATGLSYERVESLDDPLPGALVSESYPRRVESYQALLVLKNGPAALGDTRLMGRIVGGQPSAAAVPTGQRTEIWERIERERAEFRFLRGS